MRLRNIVVTGSCLAFVGAFSLPTPASATIAPGTWVAMGDSYQSGVGAGDYGATKGACERSPHSAVSLLAADGDAGGPLKFVACSGATTTDLYNGMDGEPSQFSQLGSDVSLVTLGVSGDDLHFADNIKACLAMSVWRTCNGARDPKIQQAFNKLSQGSPNTIEQIINKIRSLAPKAQIFLLTYPKFFPDAGGKDGTSKVPIPATRCQMWRTADQLWVNNWIQRVDKFLVDSATAAGAIPVDLYTTPNGHELCNTANAPDFLNGISFRPLTDSFHPTRFGYGLVACILKAQFTKPSSPAAVAGDGNVTRLTEDVAVQPGRTTKVSVPVTPGGVGIGFTSTWSKGNVSMRVLAPDGKPVQGLKYQQDSSGVAHYGTVYVPEARPGGWTLELRGDQREQVRVTATEIAQNKSQPQARMALRRNGPKTVSLDASGSIGSGGGAVANYRWDFGDGTTATGRTATHTYSKPGQYTVSLVVTGDDGQMGFADSLPVIVNK